ncbi:MAG TPA: ABC transporter permease, partial [Rhodobacterales bacterium]|nr:ABC transporter permease [Rhodobacterales bacterium]
MRYQIKIAWRYLTSNPAQSWLLIIGVALGVFVFVFMSALIGGLAVLLTDRTVGNVAHVTLIVPDLEPKFLFDPDSGAVIAAQSSSSRAQLVRNAGEVARVIDDFEGVAAISPEIVGNGFAARGAQIKPVSIVGVEPDAVSAIADIAGHLVSGNTFLPSGTVLIGKKLADTLGLATGHQLRLRSDQGVNESLTIAGVFSFGLDALDERTVYVN